MTRTDTRIVSLPTEADIVMWENARKQVPNMSAYLRDLIRRDQGTDDLEIIEVPVGENGQQRRKQFRGRWLVDPKLTLDDDPHRYTFDRYRSPEYGHSPEDGTTVAIQWRWGVALTERGALAVYGHHWNDDVYAALPELHVFTTVVEAERELSNHPAMYDPTGLFEKLRSALGAERHGEPVEWMDI